MKATAHSDCFGVLVARSRHEDPEVNKPGVMRDLKFHPHPRRNANLSCAKS